MLKNSSLQLLLILDLMHTKNLFQTSIEIIKDIISN